MTSHKEVSISCQEPLPKNSVSISDCRFSSLSLVWLCRLIHGDEMWHEFTYLHATPGRKFQSCQANVTIMKSCTHTFLTAVAIVFHSPLLPLSWYQVCHSLLCFLGGVFFGGCCCMMFIYGSYGKVGRGKFWSNDHDTCL